MACPVAVGFPKQDHLTPLSFLCFRRISREWKWIPSSRPDWSGGCGRDVVNAAHPLHGHQALDQKVARQIVVPNGGGVARVVRGTLTAYVWGG